MPQYNRCKKHLARLVAQKKQEPPPLANDSSSSSESEINLTDSEADFDIPKNAFEELMAEFKSNAKPTVLSYIRGHDSCRKTKYRYKKAKEELMRDAETCQKITTFFMTTPTPTQSSQLLDIGTEFQKQKTCREDAIAPLKKLLESKTSNLVGQDRTRHFAVLHFLYLQKYQPWKTRQELALTTANSLNKGKHVAEKIITWECSWINNRIIPEGRQGRHEKISSWFNDENVMLAVREHIAGYGEGKWFLNQESFD